MVQEEGVIIDWLLHRQDREGEAQNSQTKQEEPGCIGSLFLVFGFNDPWDSKLGRGGRNVRVRVRAWGLGPGHGDPGDPERVSAEAGDPSVSRFQMMGEGELTEKVRRVIDSRPLWLSFIAAHRSWSAELDPLDPGSDWILRYWRIHGLGVLLRDCLSSFFLLVLLQFRGS